MAVTHPPSGIGGSTPSRRIAARESCREKVESRQDFRLLLPTLSVQLSRRSRGQVVQLVDTRRSERRAPRGLGSSTLPLVIADRAGARPAFIRPAYPDRYRGLQLPLFNVSLEG